MISHAGFWDEVGIGYTIIFCYCGVDFAYYDEIDALKKVVVVVVYLIETASGEYNVISAKYYKNVLLRSYKENFAEGGGAKQYLLQKNLEEIFIFDFK